MNTGRNEFGHVYWLSGAPGAGKTSIARMLARSHGLFLYCTDEHILRTHLPAASASSYPAVARARSLAGRYFEPSADLILETTLAYLREAWELVLQDIRRLPADTGIIVEGVCLFPDLVLSVTDRPHTACLVPTEAFYLLNQPERPSTKTLLSGSPDPAAAYGRMRTEHLELARYYRESSRALGVRVFETSSEESLMTNMRGIEAWFGLS